MSRAEEPYLLLREPFRSLDEETQRHVFMSFRQLVYKDIYFMLHDHALSEDVIQEAFIKVIKHANQLRPDSNLKAWLRQVARNTSYDMLRKNKRFRHLTTLSSVHSYEETESAFISGEDVEQEVEHLLRDEKLHEAIGELKVEYRVVLLLYYIMGLSYAEISREVGISQQVLTQRLARARKKLALIFTEKWGDRHA